MNRIAALLVLTATLITGCTMQNRQASYFLNGTAVVLGGALIASAASSSGNESPTGDVSGSIGAGAAGAGAVVLGLPLLLIGGIGMLRTASEGSWAPAPAPMPYQAMPSTGVITAPGMTPARVTLR